MTIIQIGFGEFFITTKMTTVFFHQREFLGWVGRWILQTRNRCWFLWEWWLSFYWFIFLLKEIHERKHCTYNLVKVLNLDKVGFCKIFEWQNAWTFSPDWRENPFLNAAFEHLKKIGMKAGRVLKRSDPDSYRDMLLLNILKSSKHLQLFVLRGTPCKWNCRLRLYRSKYVSVVASNSDELRRNRQLFPDTLRCGKNR